MSSDFSSAGSRGTSTEKFGAGLSDTSTQSPESIRAAAGVAAEAAREKLGQAGAEASRMAADAAKKARSRGASFLTSQKDWATDELEHMSSAIREAASTLRDDGDERVATYVEQAADGIEGACGYLRERDLHGLLGDVEQLARRRPEIVFGGMFLIGVGISRFLKASGGSTRRSGSMNMSDYEGQEYGGAGAQGGIGVGNAYGSGYGASREFNTSTSSTRSEHGQSYA